MLLLKDCLLLDGSRVDILIKNDFISKIGVDLIPEKNCRILDIKGNLVTPGFADCHLHIDKSFLLQKSNNNIILLDEAIRKTRDLKSSFTHEDIKRRARQAILRAINNGTVMLRTNVDIDPIVGLKGLEVLLELRQEYQKKITIQIVAFPQEGINNVPGTIELLEEALKMGADVIGGIPNIDVDPELHIKQVFALAKKYDLNVDIHIDETDTAEKMLLPILIKETLAGNMEGKVTAAHCCALDLLPAAQLEKTLDLIKKAGINIVSLPSTNLYLQGRKDQHKVWRGLAPMKKIIEHGLTGAFASDNMQDLFSPFGNANLLFIAILAAHACHMGTGKELEQVFEMITLKPARIMGFEADLRSGLLANMVVLPVRSAQEAIIEQTEVMERIYQGIPDGRWAFSDKQVVSEKHLVREGE